jgi:hypothetical protein
MKLIAAILLGLMLGAQAEPGTVEVKVVDAFTGKGLEGATITLIPLPPARTGEDGRVVFTGLSAQNYAFRIERARYDLVDLRSVPDYLAVAAGEKKQIQIVMNPLSVVSGRVLNRNGKPVPSAFVTLMTTRSVQGRKTLTRPQSTLPLGRSIGANTDDRGEFRISDVPPGTFYLSVATNAAEGLPRSVYYPGVLDPKSATQVSVHGSDVTADVQMPSATLFSVSGTVVNNLPSSEDVPGQAIPRAVNSFYLVSADPHGWEEPFSASSTTRVPPETAESPFELVGLRPGAYILYPMAGSYLSGVTNPTQVQIEDRDVTGLRIEMKPAVDLKGRVVVEGNASTVPLREVRLGVRTKDRVPSILTIATTGVYPPDERTGEFAIAGIAQNLRMQLVVSGLAANTYVSDIRQGGNSMLREGFIWSNPAAGPIELRLSSGGGSIRGTVLDSSQQPANRPTVVLVPDSSGRDNYLLYRRALAETDGRFELRGVAPGSYKLFAVQEAPPARAEEDSEFVAEHLGHSLDVQVEPGAGLSLRLILP